jgi:hypothetical protein
MDAFFVSAVGLAGPDGGRGRGARLRSATDAEIVLLTAMPHRHRASRHRASRCARPAAIRVLTTEMAQGPGHRGGCADRTDADRWPSSTTMPRNLAVGDGARCPDAHLFHLMADNSLRALIPPPPAGVHVVDDWREAAPKIATALGL